jgi:hypothetical protein
MRVCDDHEGSLLINDCTIHSATSATTSFGACDNGVTAITAFRVRHRSECLSNPICRWLNLQPDP